MHGSVICALICDIQKMLWNKQQHGEFTLIKHNQMFAIEASDKQLAMNVMGGVGRHTSFQVT